VSGRHAIARAGIEVEPTRFRVRTAIGRGHPEFDLVAEGVVASVVAEEIESVGEYALERMIAQGVGSGCNGNPMNRASPEAVRRSGPDPIEDPCAVPIETAVEGTVWDPMKMGAG
jgi:hypothetical protein